MKNDDVELIQRVLAGDENAFSRLVRKYEKPVHALVWRKVGDFHIAEEIKSDPAWSSDGEQIAFVLHKWRTILNFIDAANWQDEETIYVINRDGSNLRQLVSEKGPDALHPTWSPDGNEIIYQQGIHLPEVGDIRQLFKINVDTRTKTQLTNMGSNSGADWFGPPALPDEP